MKVIVAHAMGMCFGVAMHYTKLARSIDPRKQPSMVNWFTMNLCCTDFSCRASVKHQSSAAMAFPRRPTC